MMKKGVNGAMGEVVSYFIVLLYSFVCNLILFFKLRQTVVSTPVEAYECVRPSSQPVTELESSSSDIRIESGDEVEPEEAPLVSTKSYTRRVTLSDLGDDAGLPI